MPSRKVRLDPLRGPEGRELRALGLRALGRSLPHGSLFPRRAGAVSGKGPHPGDLFGKPSRALCATAVIVEARGPFLDLRTIQQEPMFPSGGAMLRKLDPAALLKAIDVPLE